MIVLLGIFGLIYGGSDQARQKILEQLGYYIDPSGVKVFQEIADHAAEPKAGFLATAIGILIALFSASGIFGQLQEALNTILSVKAKPDQGIWGFIRARFLSFLMVGGICFLLLVSLTVENLLKALHGYLRSIIPGGHYLALAICYVFDLGIIILLFAMLFRYLPDVKIAWRDVWMGAALTAILFVLGKFLLGLYLGSGAAGSAYGAASSLVTLLLWIFYSTQVLLSGLSLLRCIQLPTVPGSNENRTREGGEEGSRASFSEFSFCDLLPEDLHLPLSSDRSSDSATIAEESEPSIGFLKRRSENEPISGGTI
jgi:membrane protein